MMLLLLTTTFYFDWLACSHHCKSLEVKVASGNKTSHFRPLLCRLCPSSLVTDLGWQSLENRRKNARLALFLQRSSWPFCNSMRLTLPACSWLPTLWLGHINYRLLSSRLDCYKYSFFPRSENHFRMELAIAGCSIQTVCCFFPFYPPKNWWTSRKWHSGSNGRTSIAGYLMKNRRTKKNCGFFRKSRLSRLMFKRSKLEW